MTYRFNKQKHGIIFDMDGVIIDTSGLHQESWKCISKIYSFPWDDKLDFKNDVFGTGSVDSANILFKKHIEPYDMSLICSKKSEIYYELLKKHVKSIIVPGFISFFNTVSDLGIPIGLATSSSFEEAEFVLKSLRIYHQFSAVTCISDVTHPKPHPEIYLKTCEKMGLLPEYCTGFEDSISGIKALRSAGIPCVAVGTTLTRDRVETTGLGVSSYIEDFNELSYDMLEDRNRIILMKA